MTDEKYRIVVGFDGSSGAKKALGWAAGEARIRDAQVDVVNAWTPGEFGSKEEMATIAVKLLQEEVAFVVGDEPGFVVTTHADEGHAARVLLDRAKDADMLVVGSRGHGGFAGLLLGSVGQQVTTHAGAPVVVVVKE